MKKHLWLATAALLVSACASNQPAETPATAESAVQAIAAAEAAVKKADGVGFTWRDSAALISAAKAAAAKKDYATAQKLAKSAEKQGDMAYKQYEDQMAKR